MPSRRRRLIIATGALAAAGGFLAWPMFSGARWWLPDLDAALAMLEARRDAHWKDAVSGWNPAQTFTHLAQSIEFSLDGYPELKPGWFRASLGPLARASFDLRGDLVHDLSAPIPGAPALDSAVATEQAHQRLVSAIKRFAAHSGALHPHFAFGALDHAAYARVHALHLADHLREIVPA